MSTCEIAINHRPTCAVTRAVLSVTLIHDFLGFFFFFLSIFNNVSRIHARAIYRFILFPLILRILYRLITLLYNDILFSQSHVCEKLPYLTLSQQPILNMIIKKTIIFAMTRRRCKKVKVRILTGKLFE